MRRQFFCAMMKSVVTPAYGALTNAWVVATGETRSVRDMCKYVFSKLDLNYENYIRQDSKFLRPEELSYLRGDFSKIKNELGWKPSYTFEMLMDEMIEYWLNYYKQNKS